MHDKVPRWLRERKMPPTPDAFRVFVEGIPPPTCCPRHREGYHRLLEAVQRPAGRCLVCGGQGAWRARWPCESPTPAPIETPCSAMPAREVYVDLCIRCAWLPTATREPLVTRRLTAKALVVHLRCKHCHAGFFAIPPVGLLCPTCAGGSLRPVGTFDLSREGWPGSSPNEGA